MITLSAHAGASFEQPIDMLYACHEKVRRFCSQIERLDSYLAEHGRNETALSAVAAISRYFQTAAPLHHADEEEDFFPLLRRHAPETAAEIDALAAEHPALNAAWDAVYAEFVCLQNDAAYRPDAVRLAAFAQAYARHAEREERLFALGREILPADELAAIGRRMAARRRT